MKHQFWISIAVACGCAGHSARHGAGNGSGGDTASGATSSQASGGTGGSATGGSGGFTNGRCGDGFCVAGSSATPVTPPGPVLCGGAACGNGQACCIATSTCFDAADPDACEPPAPDVDPYGRKPCASNAHCADNELCLSDNPRVCQGAGHCTPIDNCGDCQVPPQGTNPCEVCGCDGNTYRSIQAACLARTNVTTVQGIPCGGTLAVGAGGSSTNPEDTTVTACASDANCQDGSFCCAITALCYPDGDTRCHEPPAGSTFPCVTDKDCNISEYCGGATCDGPGGCMYREYSDCGVLFDPVCGCDGTSYTSAACASTRAVRVASPGECKRED